MANIINGTDTGSGGLITTGDSSDELQLQTAETTAITITSGQQSAFIAGTAAAPAVTTTGDLNTGIYFPAADNIGFATGGTIRGRWTTDGLCFGSDTAAANALDSYEEGEWTPVLQGAGGSIGSQAYSTQAGRYVKIGRLVALTGYLVLTNRGSWTGQVRIGGFPFTVISGDGAYSGTTFYNSGMTLPASNFGAGAYPVPSQTFANMFSQSNTGSTNLNSYTSYITDTTQVGAFTIIYYASA